MNKSYKVIWSKVKGCYVVVSEIAKRCSKSSSGKKVASGVLSLAIMAGINSPVFAEDPIVYDDDTHETITLDGPIGAGTVITGLGQGQLSAASTDAVTGAQLYATNQRFNEWDSAMSNLSSAVGVAQADISNLKTNYIIANSAINTLRTQVDTGINVLVNGAKVKNINPDSNYFNFVPGDNIAIAADGESVKISALGNGQVASGDTGLATGGTVYSETRPTADGTYIATANTTAANLTALDNAVKANDEGKANIALDNITDDGKTVIRDLAKESVKVINGTNTTVTEGTDGNAKTYAVNATVDGVIENGNGGIVDGGTVFNALRDQKDAIDDLLDLKANVDASNVSNHTADWGSAIGTGAVVSGNGELVTGGTVFDALQAETRPASNGNYIVATDTAGANLTALDTALKDVSDIANQAKDGLDGKANTGLDNITDGGKTVIRDLAKESVKVINGSNTTVTEGTDGNAKTYAVNVAIDGVIEDGNTGLVNGGDIYTAIQNAKDPNAVQYDNDEHSMVTFGGATATNPVALKNVADGSVAEGSTDAVNGGQLFKVQELAQDAKDGLDDKANVDASNLSGHETEWGTAIGKGAVESANGQLVTGGTVFDALQAEARPTADGNYITMANTAGANLTALDTQVKSNADAINNINNNKANTSLDNITDAGKTVIQNATNVVSGDSIIDVTSATADGVKTYTIKANISADGVIESGNTGLISGDTVFNEVRIPDDGEYIKALNTTAQNLSALDNQVKANADDIEQMATDLDAKANTGLDNITDGGKTVIRDLAKSAVKVINGTNTTVTEGTEGDAKTYAVNVTIDGAVEAGNTGLVNGGDIYNAIQEAQDPNAVKYDGDAHDTVTLGGAGATVPVALKNVADGSVAEGSTDAVNGGQLFKVQELAQDAKDGLDGKANVDASNVSDYATDWGTAIGTGTVAQGDGKLVTGDTVYNAIQTSADDLKDYVDTGLEGKANVGLDNITPEGKSVITGLVDVVAGNTNTSVTSETDQNGKKTFTVSALTNGQVAEGNEGIVTGGDIYEAIQSAKDPNAVQYDNDAHSKVTLGGASATDTVSLTNVANGAVANGSTDAVNGGQLFDVQQLALQAVNGLDGKANISLDNINDSGKAIITGLVDVVGSDNINVTSVTDASGKKTFTVSTDISADGKIVEGDTGLVSGDTVYKEVRPTDGTYVGKDNTTAENLNALDTAVNNLSANAVDYDFATKKFSKGNTIIQDINLTGRINANAGTIGDLNIANHKISGLSNATLSETSTEAVNGSQLYAVNQNIVQEVADRLAGDQALSDRIGILTDDGNYIQKDKNVSENLSALDTKVKELADIGGYDANAIHYDSDDKSKATLGGANGTTLSNVNDGVLSATSMDAVNGRQLFATNQNVTANTNAINDINDRIGTTQDGNYISSTNTVGENLGALDSELKNVSDTVNNFQVEIDGKANVDLDNISDAGKTVINDIAKNAVKVTGSGHATVTSNEVGGAMVYNVDVQANGQVAEGDNGLITGGTVYEALQNQAGDFADALAGKANVDASNVTDAEAWGEKIATGKVEKGDVRAVSGDTVAELAEGFEADLHYKANKDLSNITIGGREVIRETMKEDLDKKADITYVDAGLAEKADKADLDKKANVDASNIKVDAWDKVLGTGEVAEGETHLVNGGTVYDAIQKINRNNGLVEIGEDDTITIGAKEGGNVIDVSNKHGEGRVIKGVMTDPTDVSSAANVGYVNAVGEGILEQVGGELHKMNGRVNRVGANAAAMASLEPVFNDGDERWTLSASLGNFRDETVAAVGLFYRPSDKVLVNVRGTVGGSENMVGGGVSVALDKGENLGLSKAQLTREVRSMRAEREQDKAQIAQQNMKLMEQDQKIARLEAMMRQMATQKK